MKTPTGIELIAAERQRQIEAEGWRPEHDDQHRAGELAIAAACYAMHSAWPKDDGIPLIWPWDDKCWKPKDQLSDLIRAGALIAAEIDRLQRITNGQVPKARDWQRRMMEENDTDWTADITADGEDQ